MKSIRPAALLLVVVLGVFPNGVGAQQIFTTFVSAPDGTQLATDVYLPAAGASWPVILMRTPYGKSQHVLECLSFALADYACVVQDTRGRYASGGEDTVFRDDGADGRATVAWITEQPWFGGAIGTFGASALGITQYALAPDAHPALDCQLVMVATPRLGEHAFLQGGALRTSLLESWLAGQGALDFLDELKAHRLRDDWWAPLQLLDEPASVDAAVLHIGGWYDIFQQGAIDAFRWYDQRGGPDARGRQHLVIGPWTHGGDAGELDYGVDVGAVLLATTVPWFDHCLKGRPNQVRGWSMVSVYLMGAVGEAGAPGNRWVDLESWPPSGRTHDLYLDAGGGLSPEAPAPGETVLVSDPLDPVPTLGGANLHPCREVDGRPMGAGSHDQRPIEARSDVLVYTSEVLEEPLTAMGPVRARVWLRPDTPDLDLAVRLTDVYPDGRSMLVVDGIQRARMRCGADRECFLTPGEPVELEVDLWSTAIVFNAGHRIRVDVSGSNHPRFEVNPNDGTDLDDPDDWIVARPVLLFGPDTPSRLELTVPEAPRRVTGRAGG